MRKYLTGLKISGCGQVCSVDAPELAESRHTVVDLLQCNDGVLRQTLLRVLVKQKGLRCDRALLGRRRHRMMLRWIHDTGRCGGGGEDPAVDVAERAGDSASRWVEGAGRGSISNAGEYGEVYGAGDWVEVKQTCSDSQVVRDAVQKSSDAV